MRQDALKSTRQRGYLNDLRRYARKRLGWVDGKSLAFRGQRGECLIRTTHRSVGVPALRKSCIRNKCRVSPLRILEGMPLLLDLSRG